MSGRNNGLYELSSRTREPSNIEQSNAALADRQLSICNTRDQEKSRVLLAAAALRRLLDKQAVRQLSDPSVRRVRPDRSAPSPRNLPMDENPCAVLATDATAISKSIDLNSMLSKSSVLFLERSSYYRSLQVERVPITRPQGIRNPSLVDC